MSDYFRLRQIALATDDLGRAIDDIRHVFGVRLAYQDPHVAKYGLHNALFPFGLAFIEVVAPFRENTAAGRFMERTGGVGGYMAIFNCSDPERRGAHAAAMGVPTAHAISDGGFTAVQLHPRQCRATMIEFDHTPGEADPMGPYYPAGGDGWREAICTDVTRGIREIIVESPDPHGLGRHWARLVEKDYRPEGDGGRIDVDMINIRFAPAPAGTRESLRAVVVETADPQGVARRAAERGYPADGDGFRMCGVRFVTV
ncbi:VOC family protein [Camelimonas abortus]|uniref:VOC family protein n=1 Tax=Camelimonas abortus TaxID=1017184 RepID=A0ABV7LD79_9HYPH